MINRYEPPKAPVADVGAAPRLPRLVRALRAAAVICSALLAVVGPIAFAASPQAAVFIFACALVLVGWTSILTLVSRRAGRKLYWAAMLLNGLFVLVLNLAPSPSALLFIVPALLNMTAIEVLRRARARLASG